MMHQASPLAAAQEIRLSQVLSGFASWKEGLRKWVSLSIRMLIMMRGWGVGGGEDVLLRVRWAKLGGSVPGQETPELIFTAKF